MDVNTIKCDECGKLRLNDSNHWMEGVIDKGVVFTALVGGLKDVVGSPLGFPRKHFCGQECAMKWLGAKIGEL